MLGTAVLILAVIVASVLVARTVLRGHPAPQCGDCAGETLLTAEECELLGGGWVHSSEVYTCSRCSVVRRRESLAGPGDYLDAA